MTKATLKQFIIFCIIGCFNTAIDFGVYIFLTRAMGVYFVVANVLSMVVAMTFSFFVNRRYTFKNSVANVKKQFVKFSLVNLSALAISTGLIFVQVHYLQVHDLVAKVLVVVVTLVWNFTLNKLWTFRENTKY